MTSSNIRKQIADILYDAFDDKIQYFWFLTSDEEKAKSLIADHINYDQFLQLKNDQEDVVAVATIETDDSGYAIDIPYSAFKKQFGLIGGLLRRISYSIYKHSQDDTNANEMYIDLVAVKKSERGHGFGEQLFKKIEEHGRKLNKPHIKLNVVNNNEAGKRFYERLGYKQIAYEEENAFFKLFTKKAGFTGHYTMFKDLNK